MPGLSCNDDLKRSYHSNFRIANLISQAKPSLSDDDIYNNARRIVTAEMQNIIYGEFLPLLVGSNSVTRSNGFTKYNSEVDPSIDSEFSAAAYRFGTNVMIHFWVATIS
jgi:peroxidase